MSYLDSLLGSGKDPKTIRNVKSPEVNSRLNTLFGDWTGAHAAGRDALSDYVTSFYAKEPTNRARTGQETANIDRYFSGAADTELTQMRDRAYRDQVAADDLASKFLLRNYKTSIAGEEGRPRGDYFARAVMPGIYDVQTRAALARDAAERSDWAALENAKLSLTGRRTALDDALMSRRFMPWEAEQRVLGGDTAALSGLSQIDQANTFYGLKNRPGIGEGFLGDYGQATDAY